MREFMKIVESVDPLAAQALYDKALRVSKALSTAHYEFRAHWDREWVDAIKASMETLAKAHEAAQAEAMEMEIEDAGFEGREPSFVPQPFNPVDALQDAIAAWWTPMERDFGFDLAEDVKSAINYYHRAHPMAETSDEMSLLYSEKDLATAIGVRGGFGGFHGMDVVLTQMDMFADALTRYTQLGGAICTPKTEKAIKAGIPAILYVASLAGATVKKA